MDRLTLDTRGPLARPPVTTGPAKPPPNGAGPGFAVEGVSVKISVDLTVLQSIGGHEPAPTPEQLRESGLRPDDTLYGLYEGVPLVDYGADYAPFPNKITLFRFPLEEDFADPEELADEVTRTVVHELAHHVGIGDQRLHELGWE